jgi:nucleotide-binding universal stress UspA family protein
MRHIIVPIDGSQLSERVIPLAQALASATQGDLTLTQVVIPPWLASTPKDLPELPSLMEQAATYHLENLARPLTAGAVATLVLRGNPVDELLALSQQHAGALLVMSTHGRGGLGRLLTGSVADKIMRGAAVPVVLVRDGATVPTQLERMLVTLDGSELAEEALPVAVELALATGATLRLARVVTPFLQSYVAVAPESVYLNDAEIAELDEQAMSEAGAYLQRTATLLREQGVSVDVVVRYGTTRDELLLTAEQHDTDLLVAATHGRGGFRRWALGSVTTEMVQRAPCPVLVVPCSETARRAHSAALESSAESQIDVPTAWL